MGRAEVGGDVSGGASQTRPCSLHSGASAIVGPRHRVPTALSLSLWSDLVFPHFVSSCLQLAIQVLEPH